MPQTPSTGPSLQRCPGNAAPASDHIPDSHFQLSRFSGFHTTGQHTKHFMLLESFLRASVAELRATLPFPFPLY